MHTKIYEKEHPKPLMQSKNSKEKGISKDGNLFKGSSVYEMENERGWAPQLVP